jgi:hypothetical protein
MYMYAQTITANDAANNSSSACALMQSVLLLFSLTETAHCYLLNSKDTCRDMTPPVVTAACTSPCFKAWLFRLCYQSLPLVCPAQRLADA